MTWGSGTGRVGRGGDVLTTKAGGGAPPGNISFIYEIAGMGVWVLMLLLMLLLLGKLGDIGEDEETYSACRSMTGRGSEKRGAIFGI